ncbi:hypothetical protein HDU81_000153 [Chytriomyces hyalinus]|nr:hypothetical protein HDU81_000153 [Chytriomyces hyalinus]
MPVITSQELPTAQAVAGGDYQEHDPENVYPLCCRYHTINSAKQSQKSLLEHRTSFDAVPAAPKHTA